jgi:hypothetical protein
MAPNPPDPRAPSTSVDAPCPQSATATAGGPDSKPVSMRSPGRLHRPALVPGSGFGRPVRVAHSPLWPRTCTGTASAAAGRARKRSAGAPSAGVLPARPTQWRAGTPPNHPLQRQPAFCTWPSSFTYQHRIRASRVIGPLAGASRYQRLLATRRRMRNVASASHRWETGPGAALSRVAGECPPDAPEAVDSNTRCHDFFL